MAGEQDRVRAEWQAVAGGWRRWEPLFQSFTWPLALRMAAAVQVGDGQRVLDVGCGIGDPTLQIAVLVGPHGRVLGVDLSFLSWDGLRHLILPAVNLSLSHVAWTDLAVFDAAGRRVRTIYAGTLPAGATRLAWDGRTDAGHPAASGVYFLRMTAAGKVRSQRLVMVR